MKLSNFLVFNAVLALAFGIGFVFVPAIVLTLYGITPGPALNLVGQYFGVELIAVGLLCWLARNVSDSTFQRAIILAFLIADGIGLIVSIMGTLSGVYNAVGWSAVAIYFVLSLGFAYFQFMKPSRS
jgi:hypothetical protein